MDNKRSRLHHFQMSCTHCMCCRTYPAKKIFTVMGETIERSQPSNKLILDTCLSCSEVFYRNRGCEKAPLAFLASTFRFLTFQGTVSYWIQVQYICTSIITRNKFVRSINSLLYFHRPQPQPYQFRGRKNTPTYLRVPEFMSKKSWPTSKTSKTDNLELHCNIQ